MNLITNGLGYRRTGTVNRPVIEVVDELHPAIAEVTEDRIVLVLSEDDETIVDVKVLEA